MFKKIKDLLPKDKKFMELPSSERNKKKMKEGSDAMVDEMREFMGADGIVLYAVRANSTEKGVTGTSVYKFYQGVDAMDVLPLYEDLQEKIADSFSRTTIESLAAVKRVSDEPSGGLTPEKVSDALGIALEGLPHDVHVQIAENMKKAIEKATGIEVDTPTAKKAPKKKKAGDEFDDIIGKL